MKTLIIILLSILFATSAEAQTSDRRPISRWTLGLAAGVGGDEQSGTFIEPCGCTFKDGVGTAFHLAALSDYAISKCFRVGMGIGFNHEQTHSAADLTAPAILQGVQKNDTAYVVLRSNATFTRSTLSVAPFFQCRPFGSSLFYRRVRRSPY